MKFTDAPKKLMRIRYGWPFPGLGHQITTICYALKYCVDNDYYPFLPDDPANEYGRWTDYFEPFWDQTQRREILARRHRFEILTNDLNWKANRAGFFGENWERLAPEARDIFLDIFVIKESVRREIEAAVNELGLSPVYSSLQFRRGDKNGQFKEYGRMTNSEIVNRVREVLESKGARSVFVMTDDFRTVTALREGTSLEVRTMCRPTYAGKDAEVRTAKGHMLELLTEIAVATRSEFHFQTVNSRVSKMIRLLRDDRNCHHIFDEHYTQYTSL